MTAAMADAGCAAESTEKIARPAAFKHGVPQITSGDEAGGQLRDLTFLLFNNLVENVHCLNCRKNSQNAQKKNC